jgi:hypothetical protein
MPSLYFDTKSSALRDLVPPLRDLVRALLAVGLVLLTVATWRATRGPTFVPEVKIVNESDYPVLVEVSDGTTQSEMEVITAAAGTTTVAQEVIDQGDTWAFRFSYLGEVGARPTLDRVQLERDHWRVTIPRTVNDAMAAHHLSAPPPSP